MAAIDDAVLSQVRNIEQSTGRSMDAWVALVKESGKERHGEIVAWLKADYAFGHGNANLVALMSKRGSVTGGGDDLVDATYRLFDLDVSSALLGERPDADAWPPTYSAWAAPRTAVDSGTIGRSGADTRI